jgi:CheY-like chemotaxis protein
LTGLRVLVVDDEPDTLDLLRRVLGDSQAQVAAAPSVEAALATLDAFNPHVLISDVSMPGRDGYELIRAVRSTTSPEDLPAAALTAYSRPEDAARAREAGFQMHLSKPVEPDELVKVVARLAGREAALTAAVPDPEPAPAFGP